MIIFSPGPANISERVRRALMKPDICHRGIEFNSILTNIRKMILEISKVDKEYESIVLCGSGTSAIESVITSLGGYNKKILVVSNGIYGERTANIGRLYNINIEEIKLNWGVVPDLGQIEDILKNDNFAAVYIVHHETTTGLMNPLKDICSIAKRYGKLVLTDAISSIAGEFFDISGWGIDVVIGSANKCIQGIPGISFVLADRCFIEVAEKCRSNSFCTDLLLHLKFENEGQTPFTPSVQVFYAFEEALKELIEETVEVRVSNYKELSGSLRKGLKDLGMKFYLPEELMSNTMTVVYMPNGLNYAMLHDEFKKKGFIIYKSQGKLSETTFRLGTVGVISKQDIARFIDVFKGLL